MSNIKPVTVKPSKYSNDDYQGVWYVIERSGDEYGLARKPNFDYATVWFHKSRVEE